MGWSRSWQLLRLVKPLCRVRCTSKYSCYHVTLRVYTAHTYHDIHAAAAYANTNRPIFLPSSTSVILPDKIWPGMSPWIPHRHMPGVML